MKESLRKRKQKGTSSFSSLFDKSPVKKNYMLLPVGAMYFAFHLFYLLLPPFLAVFLFSLAIFFKKEV